MRYSDIFFDFDDTLYDTRGNANIALRETFELFNLQRFISNPDIFYNRYWEVNAELWLLYNNNEITKDFLVIERFKRPLMLATGLEVTDSLCKEISDSFLRFCSDKPGILQGADVLLKYLKEKGYRLHICSNGFHEVQFKKLSACGLKDYFNTVILSEDAGYNKPSRNFYQYAIKASGATREKTLMIGDNYLADVCGALDFGIDACLFRRWDKNFKPERNLTFIVDNIADLMNYL